MFLGLDTSNYTTSAAAFSGTYCGNVSRLLDVKPGELGLRQSDALFQHVKQLPTILQQLLSQCRDEKINAVAASTRPRNVEGSYMPCFLAGESVGRSIAQSLNIPFYAFSHQQGHIAASLWSARRLDLMQTPHLAWHLSGGTTELLLVKPDGKNVSAEKIGGTTDISAGQVIDRVGKMLCLQFPAGKAMDRLAAQASCRDKFKVRLNGLTFSFSGLENKAAEVLSEGRSPEDVAFYTVASVSDTIARVTKEALTAYPGLEVVFSGGVASNSLLRDQCSVFQPVFSSPEYATDNAMGIAVLCSMQEVG